MDEASLVERSRRGDHEAYRSLVNNHREAVFRAAFHVLKHEEEALDVVQDSFLKAYQALSKFEGKSSFRTWVRRIAVNRSLNRLRDSRKDRQVAALPEGDLLAGRGRNPREQVEGLELREYVAREIDRLSPDHALALRMHDIEGLTYAEIAELTGVKPGTVMSRIHYARKKLRERLERILSEGRAKRTSGTRGEAHV